MIEGGPGYLFGMSKLKKINMIIASYETLQKTNLTPWHTRF